MVFDDIVVYKKYLCATMLQCFADKAKDSRSGGTVALKRVKMHNEKNGKMQ